MPVSLKNYQSKPPVIMVSRTGKPLMARGASRSDLLLFAKARWHFTSSKGSDFLIKALLGFFRLSRNHHPSEEDPCLPTFPKTHAERRTAMAVPAERAHPARAALAAP